MNEHQCDHLGTCPTPGQLPQPSGQECASDGCDSTRTYNVTRLDAIVCNTHMTRPQRQPQETP